MKTLGERIRTARTNKGLTQLQLGEKVYLTRRAISNYECGKRRPEPLYLAAIAKALGIPGEQLGPK